MTTSESTGTAHNSLARDLASAARHYLGHRRALLVIALVAIVGGVTLNWSWLVAAGIAPVLLATLPCLVMCGLGLCMHKMAGGSRASQSSQPDNAETSQSPNLAQATPASPPAIMSNCCGVSAGPTPSADQQKSSARESLS